MYPVNKPSPITNDNAQDFVRALEEFIELKIMEREDRPTSKYNESIELAKRSLVDYLLVTDPRPGIYVKGENE